MFALIVSAALAESPRSGEPRNFEIRVAPVSRLIDAFAGLAEGAGEDDLATEIRRNVLIGTAAYGLDQNRPMRFRGELGDAVEGPEAVRLETLRLLLPTVRRQEFERRRVNPTNPAELFVDGDSDGPPVFAVSNGVWWLLAPTAAMATDRELAAALGRPSEEPAGLVEMDVRGPLLSAPVRKIIIAEGKQGVSEAARAVGSNAAQERLELEIRRYLTERVIPRVIQARDVTLSSNLTERTHELTGTLSVGWPSGTLAEWQEAEARLQSEPVEPAFSLRISTTFPRDFGRRLERWIETAADLTNDKLVADGAEVVTPIVDRLERSLTAVVAQGEFVGRLDLVRRDDGQAGFLVGVCAPEAQELVESVRDFVAVAGGERPALSGPDVAGVRWTSLPPDEGDPKRGAVGFRDGEAWLFLGLGGASGCLRSVTANNQVDGNASLTVDLKRLAEGAEDWNRLGMEMSTADLSRVVEVGLSNEVLATVRRSGDGIAAEMKVPAGMTKELIRQVNK